MKHVCWVVLGCPAPGDLKQNHAGGGPIDELVLLDREVDAVTPLCTQLTFEGLVDETLGIRSGFVTLDAASGGTERLAVPCA